MRMMMKRRILAKNPEQREENLDLEKPGVDETHVNSWGENVPDEIFEVEEEGLSRTDRDGRKSMFYTYKKHELIFRRKDPNKNREILVLANDVEELLEEDTIEGRKVFIIFTDACAPTKGYENLGTRIKNGKIVKDPFAPEKPPAQIGIVVRDEKGNLILTAWGDMESDLVMEDGNMSEHAAALQGLKLVYDLLKGLELEPAPEEEESKMVMKSGLWNW